MVVGSMSVATLFVREKTVADWHTRKASTLPSLERLHDSSDSLARPLVLHIGNLYHCTVDCVYSPAVACLPCHCWHSVCLDFELLLFTLVLFAHSLHLHSLPSISSGRPCDLTVSCTVAQASHYSICQCQSESVNIDSILTPVNTHTFHCLSCSN